MILNHTGVESHRASARLQAKHINANTRAGCFLVLARSVAKYININTLCRDCMSFRILLINSCQ